MKMCLDDKIKAGARAVGKKMEDHDRDTCAEYEAEKEKKGYKTKYLFYNFIFI
jgi:hypothetical protein